MAVHFGMKLYNDQRNAQVFNLFIYLLQPYMFRAGRPGADIIPRILYPLPKLYTCL
jgi:hypothetical protein